MTTRRQISDKAREYLGTPHKHRGRTKGVELDCVGLVCMVGKELGLTDHDCDTYTRNPDGFILMQELLASGASVVDREPLEGDMVVFWVRKDKAPQHVAIVGKHEIENELTLIHSHRGVGKTVEHIFNDNWKTRVHCVFQYPGVDD